MPNQLLKILCIGWYIEAAKLGGTGTVGQANPSLLKPTPYSIT
jgi:hypothetical protein